MAGIEQVAAVCKIPVLAWRPRNPIVDIVSKRAFSRHYGNPVKCQRRHLHSKLFEDSTYSISGFGCAEERSWYQRYGKGLKKV